MYLSGGFEPIRLANEHGHEYPRQKQWPEIEKLLVEDFASLSEGDLEKAAKQLYWFRETIKTDILDVAESKD